MACVPRVASVRRVRKSVCICRNACLLALVLDEQRVLRPVYEVGNTVAAVVITPDEARVLFSRVKLFPMPVGLEAGDDLGDLAAVRRRDIVKAGNSVISRLLSLVRPGKAESLHDLFLVLLHVRVVLPAQHGNLFAAHRLFMERARN